MAELSFTERDWTDFCIDLAKGQKGGRVRCESVWIVPLIAAHCCECIDNLRINKFVAWLSGCLSLVFF